MDIMITNCFSSTWTKISTVFSAYGFVPYFIYEFGSLLWEIGDDVSELVRAFEQRASLDSTWVITFIFPFLPYIAKKINEEARGILKPASLIYDLPILREITDMIVHVYPLWMLEKEASADDGIGDEVKKKSAKNNLAYLRFQRKQDKLLVTVLESGPSAINQISLIFRTHSYTTIQLVSIAISIGSLTFGSVKNLFVIRKKSEADMSQHKLSYVLYFFTMLVCNIFRLFSWALVLAYLKVFAIIMGVGHVVFTYVIMKMFNAKMDGPLLQSISANLISPCVIVPKRGLAVNFISIGFHCLNLLLLYIATNFGDHSTDDILFTCRGYFEESTEPIFQACYSNTNCSSSFIVNAPTSSLKTFCDPTLTDDQNFLLHWTLLATFSGLILSLPMVFLHQKTARSLWLYKKALCCHENLKKLYDFEKPQASDQVLDKVLEKLQWDEHNEEYKKIIEISQGDDDRSKALARYLNDGIDCAGNTALGKAIRRRHPKLVKTLIEEYGVDINRKTRDPNRKYNYPDMIFDTCTELNPLNRYPMISPLHLAIQEIAGFFQPTPSDKKYEDFDDIEEKEQLNNT